MQAQLALAAQQNSLLASAYANLSSASVSGLERMKGSRFSPYSTTRSAFSSVVSRAASPPVKTISPPSSPLQGIKNIQEMVNGLNGGPETKFGLSHPQDSRREVTQSQ